MKPPFLSNGSTYCFGADGERICTGSQMGRRDAIPPDRKTVSKLHLVRVPMSPCGAYDKGGAYWGIGSAPLWCAYGESETEQAHCFTRASNRTNAKAKAGAKRASHKALRQAFQDTTGCPDGAAVAAADYLKGLISFQEYCDTKHNEAPSAKY